MYCQLDLTITSQTLIKRVKRDQEIEVQAFHHPCSLQGSSATVTGACAGFELFCAFTHSADPTTGSFLGVSLSVFLSSDLRT